ncbi:helix-hairpin-helix domain-containing protein [Nonomuraea sp. NPDC049649]|uniref:helix-hairpin-helix domain-containing protein n=1 Tax=Nonomuraea sp. NPDC049649 TaxID=3155776 RepID=UPI003446814C
MPAHDPAPERTVAESRLRALTGSDPFPREVPEPFQTFRTTRPAGTTDPRPAGPSEPQAPKSFQAFRASTPALDPGRPALRVLLALGVAAVLVAGFLLWRAQPVPEPLPAPTPLSTPAPTAATPEAKVTVHVAGKVRKPGVYPLPTGSRVQDAITAAGGVRRGAPLGALNLARRLVDGEQIMVGAPAAAPGSAANPADAVLDLNTATQDQLEQLPGVGEVLASRIIDFRTTHGGFTSVDQLREVTGIGSRRFDEIKPKVRV